MIESFVPSLNTSFGQGLNLTAEATPKLALPVPPYAAIFRFAFDLFLILDVVNTAEVPMKVFPTVEELCTGRTRVGL